VWLSHKNTIRRETSMVLVDKIVGALQHIRNVPKKHSIGGIGVEDKVGGGNLYE